MLKISDFAQIAQVSVSMLRYYDDIHIFKPVHVDPETGYRFYTMDQLVQLNRILALKDLGISLRKITALLKEDLSPDVFHEMLKLRQAQLEQTMQQAQEQLARIEARLTYIEREGESTPPDVVVKAVETQTVVSTMTDVEGFGPNATYAQNFRFMLRQHHIEPHGYTHFIYHESQAEERAYDIEIAIPVQHIPDGDIE